jgi:hypothetical protein
VVVDNQIATAVVLPTARFRPTAAITKPRTRPGSASGARLMPLTGALQC